MKGRVVAIIVLLSGPSWAQANDSVRGLAYEAPEGCPSRVQMIEAIRGRSRSAAAALEEGTTAASIFISKAETGFEADVRVNGSEPRKLVSPECGDLVSAISFTLSLSLDEERARESEKKPVPPPLPAPPTSRVHLDVGVGARAFFAGVDPSFAPSLFVELERIDFREDLGVRWEPSVRAGVWRSFGSDVTTSVGNASFTWTAARLDICPARMGGSRWAGRVCAAGDFGSLNAEGSAIQGAAAETRAWLALGGSVRGEMRLGGPSDIASTLGIEASLNAPIVSDRFIFLPSTVVYRAPIVTGSVGISFRTDIF